MPSIQLTCPHCGSMLNFGSAIASGTPVECLACMRTFAAQALTAPEPVAARKEPATNIAVAERVAPKPPVIARAEKAPPVRRPSPATDGMAGKLVLAGVAFGLVLLFTGGIALAIWKVNGSARQSAGGPNDGPASGDPQDVPGDTGIADGNLPAIKKVEPAAPDDEDTRRLKELEKKGLTRKTPPQGGDADGKWDQPPLTFNVSKQGIPGLDQEKINSAIDKGIAYLKKTQHGDGTWGTAYPVGYASLGGLTLLECQTPADDFFVQRAAQYVRGHVQNLTQTYELSLAILFLDRLGAPRDRPLIQGMALRLLAGQNDCGGWTYNCPLLTPSEMYQLYTFLQSNKQLNLLNPLQGDASNPTGTLMNPVREPLKLNDPFSHLGHLIAGKTEAADPKGHPMPKPPAPRAKGKMTPLPAQWLPANLQRLPVVQNQGRGRGQQRIRAGDGDNSNTQFALLGIWTARRHDVPTDQALLAASQRFLTSQTKDGGWAYTMSPQGATPAMTGVGLIGLAMGHGAAPEIIKLNPNNPKDMKIKPALEDPVIQTGLVALSHSIGEPQKDPKTASFPVQNHYFLWSVERVAVLYDLKTINGKDWYGWGAQNLVHNQQADGQWPTSFYPGATPAINSCFALLFLKRSNLVQDLTNNLRLYTGIRDPDK